MSGSTKAQNLLRRFPLTDLAIAVAQRGSNREAFLRRFVESRTGASYEWTRAAAQLIYCVEQPMFRAPMFPTLVLPWEAIEAQIRRLATPHNVARNVEASRALFDLVRPRGYKAYYHDPQVLRVRLLQVVPIDLAFYCLDGTRLLFQFPQPRRQALSDEVVAVMISIIHHAYAVGDYAEADVEIADLGTLPTTDERAPRIRTIPKGDILGREELTAQIAEVYDALRILAERREDTGPGGGDLL